jgi:endoglucanase
MYAIVDWHIHAENPWDTVDQAKTFFKKYATMYKDYDNVIFEICNEPTNVKWYTNGKKDLYAYAKTITKVIRDCGSNAIIVCGTNTWSQDVDEVAGHTIDDGNVMYTFHFYAATHKDSLRQKVTKAYNAGIPIFVTEFGTCDASGAGGYDFDSADTWINLLDKYGIPYCNWSLCNKAEAASMLKSSCKKTDGGWVGSDLTRSGTWLVNTYRSHEEKEK